MERIKLAVYGTLKKGRSNHNLIKHCNNLGEGYIGKGYGLFVDGLPYLIEDEEGPGCYVEIYEIDIPTLKRCDRLEGHPDWYRRTLVDVIELETGHKFKCYAYIYQGKERGRNYVRRF